MAVARSVVILRLAHPSATAASTTSSVRQASSSSSTTNKSKPKPLPSSLPTRPVQIENETQHQRRARLAAAEEAAFGPSRDLQTQIPSWYDAEAMKKQLAEDAKRAQSHPNLNWERFKRDLIHRPLDTKPVPPTKATKPILLPPTAAFRNTYPYGWMVNPVAKDGTVKAELKEELKGMFEPAVIPQLSVLHPWTPNSVRVGAIAKKMGMLTMWSHHGEVMPVTILKVDHCQVTSVTSEITPRGRVGVQVGAGAKKIKNVNKAEMAHASKAGVWPKAKYAEFPVTPDAVLPVGYHISVRHFKPGQYIDVCGITIGKGFQGGMKRWGFAGQPATHGVSVSHRSIGSTGNRQDPGRVWKGKKMPGRMGGERVTTLNLQVVRLDTARDLLYVKGHVPGFSGNWLVIRDAIKRPWHWSWPPPFPTHIPSDKDPHADATIIDMETRGIDPFAYGARGASDEPAEAPAAGDKKAAAPAPAKKK